MAKKKKSKSKRSVTSDIRKVSQGSKGMEFGGKEFGNVK